MKKIIKAVVEITSFNSESPWIVSSFENYSFLRLSPSATDEEIGSIILTACLYNQIDIRSTATETLRAFIAQDFVLPGGLQFLENEKVKIAPGCCSGLEDWREWLEVPNGYGGVWAGHDPNPGVEFVAGKIRVWQDVSKDKKANETKFIDFEIDEMRNLLEKVESDLKGFVMKLEKWTDFVAPGLKQMVGHHFAQNMRI